MLSHESGCGRSSETQRWFR